MVIINPKKAIEVGDDPPVAYMDNLDYRCKLATRINAEEPFRKLFLERAASDVIYWVNSVGWTYQAKPYPLNLPMILYPIQRRLMWLLQKYGGRRHFHTDKSRDMGITWCYIFYLSWAWNFIPKVKIHMASWKGELVDKAGHMGTHFAKLDHINEWMPESISPMIRRKFERQNMYLRNPITDALISGEGTTKKMGRQDRNFCAFLDEFPHMGDTAQDGYAILEGIKHTTDCMMMNGTPYGVGNAFADYKSKAHVSLSFWWPDHPIKGADLDGDGVKSKPESGFWSDDVEGLRGNLSSPWHRVEEEEAPSKQFMSQELEIDYSGSGWQFFPERLVRKVLATDVSVPLAVGNLIMNPDSAQPHGFDRDPKGNLQLWCHLRDCGTPSKEPPYVCGVDVAQGNQDEEGRGSSVSCAVIVDGNSGEVVADLSVSGVISAEFGSMVVALCRFFHNAYLIYEANGPGLAFGDRVARTLYYSPMYWRQNDEKVDRQGQKVTMPGFWTTPKNKPWVFEQYLLGLKNKQITERCYHAARELRMFQNKNGSVVHAIADSTPDPTGAKEAHGDRVTARVMAFHAMVDRKYNVATGDTPPSHKRLPDNSIANFEERRKMELSMQDEY